MSRHAQDHYRVLQVTRDAEPEVIERAYKALSMKYHPDRMPPERRKAATRHMQAINEAYSVLRDPARRTRYDSTLPGERAAGWDVFLEDGIIGLFRDKFGRR